MLEWEARLSRGRKPAPGYSTTFDVAGNWYVVAPGGSVFLSFPAVTGEEPPTAPPPKVDPATVARDRTKAAAELDRLWTVWGLGDNVMG